MQTDYLEWINLNYEEKYIILYLIFDEWSTCLLTGRKIFLVRNKVATSVTYILVQI